MSELVSNSLKLFQQMQESKGHFYYAGEGAAGNKRRKELAKKLHALGLR
ncbi:MAG: hypothetical protein GXP14_07675 [Gammaproteobacteria bacterium]|nr:hypothetical protein [Gammaproteobacteria bacterium]